MSTHPSTIRWAATWALLAGLAALSHTTACGGSCPEQEPFHRGEYTIAETIDEHADPLQQAIVDRATGAQLTLDRDANVATIRYTHDGTTYDVHFALH